MLLTPKFDRHQVGAIRGLHYANLIDIRGIIPLISSAVRVGTVIGRCRDVYAMAIDINSVTDNGRRPRKVCGLNSFQFIAGRGQNWASCARRRESYLVKVNVLLTITTDQCSTVYPRSKC